MINTYEFGTLSVQKNKITQKLIAIFIKDLGCFSFFYGGTSVIAKHWR